MTPDEAATFINRAYERTIGFSFMPIVGSPEDIETVLSKLHRLPLTYLQEWELPMGPRVAVYRGPHDPRWLPYINWHRDNFASRQKIKPFILWCGDEEWMLMSSRNAPDLWSVRDLEVMVGDEAPTP